MDIWATALGAVTTPSDSVLPQGQLPPRQPQTKRHPTDCKLPATSGAAAKVLSCCCAATDNFPGCSGLRTSSVLLPCLGLPPFNAAKQHPSLCHRYGILTGAACLPHRLCSQTLHTRLARAPAAAACCCWALCVWQWCGRAHPSYWAVCTPQGLVPQQPGLLAARACSK